MQIGIPKEVKDHEYRVGMTPGGVDMLIQAGHRVLVQASAGEKAGFSDEKYLSVGAKIVKSASEIYQSDLVVKVKEPIESEYGLIHEGLILFCYLHLAPNRVLTEILTKAKCIAIAYDTVSDEEGDLPLLRPMSAIAGRMAIQVGAMALQVTSGGKGILLGGAAGVLPGRVVILGGGVLGTEAAKVAIGFGADVIVIDKNIQRLKQIENDYGPAIKTLYSNHYNIACAIKEADLLIGAVLIPGKSTPKLITQEMLRSMEPGSVFVDAAIDQGGCSETSRPTTHSKPTYIEEGVVHYCVTNMPGAVPKTASEALTNATLNYILELANKGGKQALKENRNLRQGLNVYFGHVTNAPVAADLNYTFTPAESII